MHFALFFSIFALATTSLTSAFPGRASGADDFLMRQTVPGTTILSSAEGNDGSTPSLVFNPLDQFVDVRPGTAHQFVPPLSTDKRGPCPGLNAAANHGFIPRNGLLNTAQAVSGLLEAYSFGVDIGTFLAALSIAIIGDPIAGTWSIGGPYPAALNLLESNPEGLSYSHITEEGDASPTRMDAYINNGDAYTLNLDRFEELYFSATNFTLDVLRDHAKYTNEYSIANNPSFFNVGLGGLLGGIITHNLIPNLMSNHSDEHVSGYLDREILKSFYSIIGPDEALVYTPGQEQIPQNWYKRSTLFPFTITSGFIDIAISVTKYPELGALGGNTGTTNSFAGVDLGDLTGGAYTSANSLQENNLGCFAFQAAQQAVPSALSGLISTITTPLLSAINDALSPVTSALNCPALTTWNKNALIQHPGAGYHPAGS